MNIGAVVARARANWPTCSGEPSLASTMVIANQEAALITLPTNVHEKLARRVKPEGRLGTDVFKLVVSSLA